METSSDTEIFSIQQGAYSPMRPAPHMRKKQMNHETQGQHGDAALLGPLGGGLGVFRARL